MVEIPAFAGITVEGEGDCPHPRPLSLRERGVFAFGFCRDDCKYRMTGLPLFQLFLILNLSKDERGEVFFSYQKKLLTFLADITVWSRTMRRQAMSQPRPERRRTSCRLPT